MDQRRQRRVGRTIQSLRTPVSSLQVERSGAQRLNKAHLGSGHRIGDVVIANPFEVPPYQFTGDPENLHPLVLGSSRGRRTYMMRT